MKSVRVLSCSDTEHEYQLGRQQVFQRWVLVSVCVFCVNVSLCSEQTLHLSAKKLTLPLR